MSHYFSDEFFNYLSENIEDGISSNDLKKLFDNFFISKNSGKSVHEKEDTKVISKNSGKSVREKDDTKNFIEKNSGKTTSKQKNETYKCERIPRGKTDPCGKLAKKSIEVEGKLRWYCGTENSGCYHSILGSTNKKEKNEKSKVSSDYVPKKSSEDIKSQSLIHKLIKKEELLTRSMNVGGVKVYIHPDSRVLFHRNRKAYGILDKDDKTILPIDDKNARWLEASNIEIEHSVKKTEDSEEEEEECETVESDGEEDIEISDDEDDEEEEENIDLE